MKRLLVTQRVDEVSHYEERRDGLDQNWHEFLNAAGFFGYPVPNSIDTAKDMIACGNYDGFLLTGGNDLVICGGNAPERDLVEDAILRHAIDHRVPLLGVCRGLQVIQNTFGVPLEKVSGHIAVDHSIEMNGATETVNSYHTFGAFQSVPELDVLATAEDGVIEAVRHTQLPILGIMWHPERCSPFSPRDIESFRTHFMENQ